MTLEEAVIDATTLEAKRLANGVQQDALEAAARQGFANGAFEESCEEMPEILEEFFNDSGTARRDGNHATESHPPPATGTSSAPTGNSRLKEKLDRQGVQLNPVTVSTLRSMTREVFESEELE